MSFLDPMATLTARRTFLGGASLGLGTLALQSLLDPALLAGESGRSTEKTSRQLGAIDPLHFAPKAKRVIFLCMAGGPSHLETFDYKPKLAEMSGQAMPASFTKGQPIAQLQDTELRCQGPMVRFRKHGKSGQSISDFFPHISGIADDICIVRSMVTQAINHDPAHTLMNTGSPIVGRPSMGSWFTYGLGTESQDLPGFVVLSSEGGRNPQPINSRQWHNGFLPGRFQGVPFHSRGAAVHYIRNPQGVDAKQQQDVIGAVKSLNEIHAATTDDQEIATRISQYELAFQMQRSVPALMDVSDEPQSVLDMYGTQGGDGSFASNCLLARRLAERGVRFIQLYHRGWDHHEELARYMKVCSGHVDQATAALVRDLKQRDMLKDTLIVWGGEFGRTPMVQGRPQGPGRDHHMKGFSMWLAGGGIRGGMSHGATDELGYNSVDKVVNVHDLHATMLHLMGIDHLKMTVRAQGRDYRLTDIHGQVVKEILA